MIVPRVHRGVSWRHPYLVPAYAFVVSLLLATAVTVLSAPAEAGTVLPQSPGPAPSEAPALSAPIEEFRAAAGGIPKLVVVADQPLDDPPPVNRVVLMPSGKEPNSYIPDPENPEKAITVGADQKLEKSVVDRLVCVSAPAKFKVSAPVGIAELVKATSLDPEYTSCQGAWSDALAVPAELTFIVRTTG